MNTGKMPHGMTALTPMLTLKDVDAAVAFYQKAFGFTHKYSMPGPDGHCAHAEMSHGGTTMMLGKPMPGKSALPQGEPSLSLYLYVEDVDKFLAHATANGATVKQPCTDMFWGDRMCALVDPFGYHWGFGTFVKEVKPEDLQKAMQAQMAGAKK
ncbi:MAG TPA: VOC family protein [Candidatus Xenobia bacterium]|jgi:PhnB protein